MTDRLGLLNHGIWGVEGTYRDKDEVWGLSALILVCRMPCISSTLACFNSIFGLTGDFDSTCCDRNEASIVIKSDAQA